jgi:hypothetical protein
MVGLEIHDPDIFRGMDEIEQAIAYSRYREIIWRAEMIAGNRLTISWTELMEIPGVILDAIQYIQSVKEESKEDPDGSR